MNRIRFAGMACLAILLGSLLLARIHPLGDAAMFAGRSDAPPIMEGSSVPPDVRAILTQKCGDCHSTQTRAPLYGRFAPVSWLMERDIVEGRRHMNLSRWEAYSDEDRQNLQAQILQQTEAAKMPLPQYVLIHRRAKITVNDLSALRRWAAQTPLLVPAAATAGGPGDPIRGKATFEKRCTGCHSLDQSGEGPRLGGVYGRRTASVTDFSYSAALTKSGIVWNDESLEKWLADPDTLVPGNDMAFRVAKPEERRDLVAFLKQSR